MSNLKEKFTSERGEITSGTVIKVALVALTGIVLYQYGVETFNQVLNCDKHVPWMGLHTQIEHAINIQPSLNKYVLSFFEGAFGHLRLISAQVTFCLK